MGRYIFENGGEMPQEDNFFGGYLDMMEQGLAASQQEYAEPAETVEDEDEFITNLRAYDDEQEKLSETDKLRSMFDDYVKKIDERMAYMNMDAEERGLFDDDDESTLANHFDTRNNPAPFFSRAGKASGNASGMAKKTYQDFVSMGYPAHVAAGIAANIQHESGFNTRAVGDGGKARGYAQWHPDRYKILSQKFDLSTHEGNIAAIDYELKNSEKGAYAALQGARTPSQAAQIFDQKYERSAGLTTRQRMSTAEQLYTP